MMPADFLRLAVVPGLAILPTRMDTPSARVQLVATGLQESRLVHRWQVVDVVKPETKGPARGLLQFERGGGVRGVLRNSVTRDYARAVCLARGVAPDESAVWLAMEHDDLLSVAFGRLLLLADPHRLPLVGKDGEAFECYVRCWQPGAYTRGTDAERAKLRQKWSDNYAMALAACSPL